MLAYIFSKILFMSIAGAAAVTLITLLGIWAKKAFSNRWNYYIWLLPLAILLIPFAWRAPAAPPLATAGSAPAQQSPAAPPVQPVQPDTDNTAAVREDTQKEAVDANTIATAYPKEPGSLAAQHRVAGNIGGRLWTAAQWAWLSIAALLLVRRLIQTVRFRRGLRRISCPAPPELQAAFAQTARSMGLHRAVRMRTFAAGGSPFVTGTLRPVVYLPEDTVSGSGLDMVLRHELTHCRRFDLLYKTVVDIAAAVHFFNPLVYYLRRQADRYCELSCDEQVVRGMDTDVRKHYSRTILLLMRRGSLPVRGGAALFEKRTNTKERIENIMNSHMKRRLARAVSIALVLVLGLSGFAFAGAVNSLNPVKMPGGTFHAQALYNFSTYFSDATLQYVDMDSVDATYTESLLGITFEMSVNAWEGSKEEQPESFENLEYTDVYALKLERVLRRFNGNNDLEGLFTLTKNGETVFAQRTGYMNNLPGHDSNELCTITIDPLFTQIPEQKESIFLRQADLGVSLLFEEQDGERANAERIMGIDLRKNPTYRHVRMGEIAECRVDENYVPVPDLAAINQGAQRASWYSGEVHYDVAGQTAQVNFILDNSYIRLGIPAKVECSEDGIRGHFTVQNVYCTIDSFDGSLSGLSNPEGGYAELKSDDGRYYIKAKIIPVYHAPLGESVRGTGDPEDYYTEGEDVFIGQWWEQDAFDAVEHDRFYKRILTDDYGKVLAVCPVEYQQGAALVEDHSQPLRSGFSWHNVVDAMFSNNARMLDEHGNMATVMYEGKTNFYLCNEKNFWIRFFIPPENQLMQEPPEGAPRPEGFGLVQVRIEPEEQ